MKKNKFSKKGKNQLQITKKSPRELRENNLKAKEKIIEQIRELVENNNQVGSFKKIRFLRDEWGKISFVAGSKSNNLHNTYHALMRRFYNNKRIENDLREVGEKENLKKKLLLCQEVENLLDQQNVSNAIKEMKNLHYRFKCTGPAPKEKEEGLLKRFKNASEKLYKKKEKVTEDFKNKLKDNMHLKQELCKKVEYYATLNIISYKEWKKKIQELFQIRKEWESIGPIPRKVQKDIEDHFWNNFRKIFNQKNKFLENLQAEKNENLRLKNELIKKAEALKENNDWKVTSHSLREMQKKWEKIGAVPGSDQKTIYSRFKKACDIFFERKRTSLANVKKEFENNLSKKLDICNHIHKLSKEKPTDIEAFKKLTDSYFSVNFAYKNEEKFTDAVNQFLNAADISEKDKIDIRADIEIKLFKNHPNPKDKVIQKRYDIGKKINALEYNIRLWKRNLQFFNSKSGNELVSSFKNKIQKTEKELVNLKNQMKMIKNMEDKLINN